MNGASRRELNIRRHKVNYGSFVVVIAVGVLLIGFAIPILMAELGSADVKGVVEQLKDKRLPVKRETIIEALKATDTALDWTPKKQSLWSHRITLQLGLYERYYASLGGKHVEGRELLEQIRSSLVTALSHGPSNSHLWYALSEVDIRLSPRDGRMSEYLEMSYLTGPREGWIASRRLAFSLKNWGRLDREGRLRGFQDLDLLWNEKPFHQYLARVFVKASPLGRSLIYRHISEAGQGGVDRFRRSLDQIGWKSDKPLLYAVTQR